MTRVRMHTTLGTTSPNELRSRSNVKEGDRLVVIENRHGVMVTPYDPQFERTMRNADQVIERFKHAYKVLADR